MTKIGRILAAGLLTFSSAISFAQEKYPTYPVTLTNPDETTQEFSSKKDAIEHLESITTDLRFSQENGKDLEYIDMAPAGYAWTNWGTQGGNGGNDSNLPLHESYRSTISGVIDYMKSKYNCVDHGKIIESVSITGDPQTVYKIPITFTYTTVGQYADGTGGYSYYCPIDYGHINTSTQDVQSYIEAYVPPENQFNYTITRSYTPLTAFAEPTADSCPNNPDDVRKDSCDELRGNPINVATGNKTQTELDYSGKYLKFERFYNSEQDGHLHSNIGNGWTHSYSDRITLGKGTGYAKVRNLYTKAGHYDIFNNSNSKRFSDRKLIIDSANELYYYSYPKEDRVYDSNGLLLKIVHQDGLETIISRNPDGGVDEVTDPFGRKLIFSYIDINGDKYISSVLLPDGNSISYSYDGVENLEYVTYQNNDLKTYHYEDPNYSALLTGITDERGVRYATWSYDSSGRAISSSHAGHETITLSNYLDNSDGTKQVTITNSKGVSSSVKFKNQNGVWRLYHETNPDGGYKSNYFSPSTYAQTAYQRANPNGVVTFNNSNYHSGLTSTYTKAYRTSDAQTMSYSWGTYRNGPSLFHQINKVVKDDYQIEYTYDKRLVKSMLIKDLTNNTVPYSTNGNAREWKYEYNTDGLLIFIEGPRVTTADDIAFTYDLMGNIETVSRGDCTVGTNCLVTTYSNYDANGRPGTITDANGIVTDITYTPRGWVETVTEVRSTDSVTTTYEYDGVGNVSKVIMPNNSFLTYEYNDANYLEAIENSLGERIEFTVDTEGMITKQTIADASSSVVSQQEWVYSNTNRLLKMISGAGFETSYTYDPVGNPLTVTNDLSQVTTFTYDALNRIATEVDAKNGTVSKTYTKSNKVATVTDQKGNVTSYTYNGFGDLIQVVSPDTGTEVYIVDRAGNTTQKTMNDGTIVNYTYDPLNRVTSMTFPSSSSEDVAYGYDNGVNAIGKLTDVVYEYGTITYSYNSQGLLDSSTNVIDGQTYVTSYDYNNMGHVTDITYPSGMEVSYSLDTLNRVSGVSVDGVNVVNNISYLPFSNTIDAMSYQNGVSFNAGYNLEYAPTNFVHSVLGIDLANDTYSYELSDRISSITDSVDPTKTQTFAYSNVGELLNATGGYGTISYTYDATGNRTSLTDNGISSSYAVDALSNRLNSVTDPSSTRSFTYDLNGNVEQDVKHDGTVVDLSYNANNRLNSVTVNSTTYEYGYNPFGQRVIESGKINSYGQSGELLSIHDGVTYKEYVYLNGMKVAVVEDGSISYIHNNYLGVPKVITDSSGAVVWEGDYKPFGEMYDVNGTLSNNIRFPGQYQNEESGYSYNYFRNYDPTIGRYLQSDPIGLGGGINTYGYVGGNPVSYTDPLGLKKYIVIHSVSSISNLKNGSFYPHSFFTLVDTDISKDPQYAFGFQPALNVVGSIETEKLEEWENYKNSIVNSIQYEISDQSYNDVINWAKNYKGKYNAVTNNCADFSKNAFEKATGISLEKEAPMILTPYTLELTIETAIVIRNLSKN